MTQNTSTTAGLFLQAIDLEIRYLSGNVKQKPLKDEIDLYLTHINEIAQRYNPNRRIGKDESLRRFRYEVASTTILIITIDEWLKSKGLPDLASLATNGIRKYLPLTDIPNTVRELCHRLSKSICTPSEFALLLKTASDIRFERNSKYLFSEYYTPPTVAKQIIHYAFPKNPEDLPHQRFIDPACGNGSLLALFTQRYIGESLNTGYTPEQTLHGLQSVVHGFDIQPFSVVLTRLSLLLEAVNLLFSVSTVNKEPLKTLFNNISLGDPLPQGKSIWHSGQLFDGVIANPPYAKIVSSHVDFIEDYRDVIHGHANLYQLFLWWAIKATKSGGTIAFLVPQSFRSGLYFEKLRAQIEETCVVKAITHISHRTNVFEDVDQALACIALQRRSEHINHHRMIKVEIFQNGSTAHQPVLTHSLRVEADKLTRKWGKTIFWILSDNQQDYRILDKVLQHTNILFQESCKIRVSNGGFVWNQQKHLLLARPTKMARPLISAPSISPFRLAFPLPAEAPSYDRQFVRADPNLTAPLYNQEVVVVQRTTAHKSGRRVVGALLTDDTLSLKEGFYIENHVNVVQAVPPVSKRESNYMLWGVSGWLNSRLLNFVFDMLNGSAHISTYELGLLPFPEELIMEIGPLICNVDWSDSPYFDTRYEKLERITLDFFGLTKVQRERLKLKIP